MKRPQLKSPELKAPAFARDIYHDMRDRRLLPVAALLLIAIVATPFLLRQGSEPEVPPAASAAIQALKEERGRKNASLVVVEAKPGLRDYRKRLRNRKPLDPFRKVGRPSLKGAKLGKGGGGDGSGSSEPATSTSKTVKETTTRTKNSETTTKTETTTTNEGSAEGKDGSGGLGGKQNGGNALPTYTIDVQISFSGPTGVSTEPLQRTGVRPLKPLPSKEKPVVTYLGPASDPSRALFSVSKDVTAIFGEARCVSGAESCEVLELTPDFPVTFVYGPAGDRYRIKLLAVERAGGS